MDSHIKKMYINGQWTLSRSGATLDVRSPATGRTVGIATYGGREETSAAIAAADAAFGHWSALSGNRRAEHLHKLSELIRRDLEDIVPIVSSETGKPLREARTETISAADNFAWYAEEAKRVYGETIPSSTMSKRLFAIRQPVGVVAAITPWNYPISTVARKIAPALAAGCTVVLKPSELTPLAAVKLFELLEEAGFPPGTANLVLGEPSGTGQEMVANKLVKKIAFTGSTRTGKLLMQGAAASVKRISLELGGHAPFIVFDDADLASAVEGVVASKFRCAGQTCVCANRLYVHERIVKPFTELLVARVNKFVVGDGRHPDTEIGPLIDERGLAKVLEHIGNARANGAEVLTGGYRLMENDCENGYFCAPTVLAGVTAEMTIMREETFGPVLPVISFRDDEEAIRLANDTPYGLSAYMYSQSVRRCLLIPEQLQFGMIGVNDGLPNQVQTPFGGLKESGFGLEGGHWGLDNFLYTKLISCGLQ